MNKPDATFAKKLDHAARIVGNWAKGMQYTEQNLAAAFRILETARAMGYAVPVSK